MKRKPRLTREQRRLRAAATGPEVRQLIDQINALHASGHGVVLLNRGHSDECDLIVSGECTCSPTHTVGPLTPEAVKSAADSMQQWRRERLS